MFVRVVQFHLKYFWVRAGFCFLHMAAPVVEHDSDVYCIECEMWLNGPTQHEDHLTGRKHKKNFRRWARKANKALLMRLLQVKMGLPIRPVTYVAENLFGKWGIKWVHDSWVK